jgi:hypothetical protein
MSTTSKVTLTNPELDALPCNGAMENPFRGTPYVPPTPHTLPKLAQCRGYHALDQARNAHFIIGHCSSVSDRTIRACSNLFTTLVFLGPE